MATNAHLKGKRQLRCTTAETWLLYREGISMAGVNHVNQLLQSSPLEKLLCKVLFLRRDQVSEQPRAPRISLTLINFCKENKANLKFLSSRMLNFSIISAASITEEFTSL